MNDIITGFGIYTSSKLSHSSPLISFETFVAVAASHI